VPEITVIHAQGGSRVVPLPNRLLTFGRSAESDFPYPMDSALSRRHLKLYPEEGHWYVEDLNSKNGTRVNGVLLQTRTRLEPGDRIEAGGLELRFDAGSEPTAQTVVFVPDSPGRPTTQPKLTKTLKDVVGLGDELPAAVSRDPIRSAALIQILIEAGRELSGHRSLNELFVRILELMLRSVSASRGVVMTLEDGVLVPQAAIGDQFQISRTIRDRVLERKESLLIADLSLDESLKSAQTLVFQRVRSLMAAPLQIRDQVTGLIYVDSPEVMGTFKEDDLGVLTVLANIAAARIEQARLLEVENQQRLLRQELDQAAEIQRNLFPKVTPDAPGMEVAGLSEPCRAVGGDFYDYLRLPDGRLAVLLGDVAGKGLPAALLMSGLMARIQVLAGLMSEPAELITRLNRIFSAHCPGNRFVTLFFFVVDPRTGEFSYCNAGHNPPFLLRTGGGADVLSEGGPVLGLFGGLPYSATGGVMQPGDTLLIFSDGVSEAVSPTGEELGEDRLLRFVRTCQGLSAGDLLQAVYQEAERFMAGTPAADDFTIVALRRILG